MHAMNSVFDPEDRYRGLACLLTQIGDWGKALTNNFHSTLIILMFALIAGQHWGKLKVWWQRRQWMRSI